MRAHMPVSTAVYFGLLLAVVSTVSVGQTAGGEELTAHATDLVIGGGPIFMAWPPTDSFMTCGLTVLAPTQKSERRKPVLLMLVIDISRTMQGEPLKYVKQAALGALEMLSDGDILGVVAFSTYARVAYPMQPLSAGVRPSARNAVSGLGDEDRRNTLEGLVKAAEQFERFGGQDAVGRHLFLITNGDANEGKTGSGIVREKTLALAQKYGFAVSTFGFKYFDRTGDDFDEDLLYDLAEKTRGRYFYVDDPRDMPARVAEEADRVLNATARKVRIEISPPGHSSQITNVDGGIVEDDGRILVGDMGAGDTCIVTFDIEGRPTRQRDCEVRATYMETDRLSEREVRVYLDIPFTGGSTRLNPKVAPRLIVYDLQASLAETSQELIKNRKAYTMVFRDKVKDLEQENVILASDYVREALKYFEKLEWILDNSSIENTVVIKVLKYRAQQLLLGK